MKKFSIILSLTSFALFAQNSDATCEILSKINEHVLLQHVNPKPIDDSLSVFVFDNLIDELDPSRKIFLKSEYDALAQNYRLKIDDYIKNKNCSFLPDIITTYKNGLLRNKKILEKINIETIDYNQNDTIRFLGKDSPIYLLEKNVEKVWRKKIKFEILNDVTSISKNLDSIKSNFNALAIASKNTIIQNELCRVNTILEADSNFQEDFYNHFCNYFDPHTAYFSNASKSSFIASLSKDKLSLGLAVNLNRKNEIIVEEIDPNGPAFQTGKIKIGDQIVSISNQKETIQVSCATLESISNMIQSESNKKITLTLKRNSGKSFDVYIEKQILRDVENTVYSFVVEKDLKFGYIKVPSFYSDFEVESGRGCADDVARELIKLEKDDIKGLVLDFTDNGGGSMEEAIKLAGIFINYGPISIVCDNQKTLSVLEDPYKGVLYKGPIVLIINGNSASASEFFASVLQDYNRAVLIGSTSLGKATMQAIVPLEKSGNQNFIKITVNKFYRITGKSSQAMGVVPDVQIPFLYEPIFQKENDFPSAIKNDTIPALLKFKPHTKHRLIEELSKKSAKRIATDPYFKSIKTINDKIDFLISNPRKDLQMTVDAFFEQNKIMNSLWDEISNFDDKSVNLNITNSNYNKMLLYMHPSEKINNQSQLEALKTNHYLKEATSIIEDFYTK